MRFPKKIGATGICSSSYKTCSTFGDCSDCNEGYLHSIKECLKPCPERFCFDSSKKCLTSVESCPNCIYIKTWIECVKDMYLYDGESRSTCPDG